MRVKLTHGLLSFLLYSTLGAQDFYHGDLSTPNGDEACNPCAENVVQAVNTLRDHGTSLGFHWGDNYPVVEGAGTPSHWQGIQRLPIMNFEVPYLAVSSSHRTYVITPVGIQQVSGPAHFAVVEMGSRRGNRGLRLRSNRLEFGKLTRNVAPDPKDRIAHSHVITSDYDHPGGMQSIGQYLLVGSDGNIEHSRQTASFSLWDMSHPLSPRNVWGYGWELPVTNANSVGIARLEDGRYFMVRALGDAKELEFYLLSDDLEENPATYHEDAPWDRWHYSELQSELEDSDGSLDRAWADLGSLFGDAGYQNTNLVTECETGDLFLICTHGRRPESIGGADFVDAYRIDIPKERPDPYSPGEGVTITKVAKRQMFPSGNANSRQGDLQAAAGIYVSPNHQLYVYATEHGVTGKGDFVQMIEFAPQAPKAKVTFLEEAWVELYQYPDFGGRSIILDYVDRELRDYNDFSKIEEFDNKISSAVFAIPSGFTFRLFSDHFGGGGYLDLDGTGRVVRLSDFSELTLDNGQSADDCISSAEWMTTVTSAPAAEEELPDDFELSQNFPNPFNGETVIRYQVPHEAEIVLEIYNMSGQLIRSLVDETQGPGFYSVTWDSRDEFGAEVASGTYLYRLRVGEQVMAKKLTLVR